MISIPAVPETIDLEGVRVNGDSSGAWALLEVGDRPAIIVIADPDDATVEIDLLDLIAWLRAHRPELLEAVG